MSIDYRDYIKDLSLKNEIVYIHKNQHGVARLHKNAEPWLVNLLLDRDFLPLGEFIAQEQNRIDDASDSPPVIKIGEVIL